MQTESAIVLEQLDADEVEVEDNPVVEVVIVLIIVDVVGNFVVVTVPVIVDVVANFVVVGITLLVVVVSKPVVLEVIAA